MIDKAFDINSLIGYKENNQLEAKKATGGLPHSMWETYSSFANTDGGVILLGVEEKKDGSLIPVGVDNPEQMVKDIWNTVNNQQKVSVNLLMDKNVTVESVDGKEIVMVKVPRAERFVRPVYLNQNPESGSYRRNGEGDYHCTKEEVSAMFRDASRVSQDQKVLTNKNMSAFCMDTVHSYRNLYNSVHPSHVWRDLDDETFLLKIGAVGYDENLKGLHPTVAGLLMFGYEYEMLQEFPQYFLDYQEHKDPSIRWTDRLVSNNGEWSGNLFDFFFSVSNKLTADLPRPIKLDGIIRVDDTFLHQAVREALLNTLVNADYYGRRGVVITKSLDGFTFSNPGDFRIPVKEAIGGGISDPRNSVIFKMFVMVNLGERAGSGLPTIYKGWEEAYGEAPTLTDSHNPDRVKLILHCENIAQAKFSIDDKPTDNRHIVGDKSAINTEIGDKSAINDEIVAEPTDNRQITGDKSAINTETGDKSAIKAESQDKKVMIMGYLSTVRTARSSEIANFIGLGISRTKDYLGELAREGKIVIHGANKNRTYSLMY